MKWYKCFFIPGMLAAGAIALQAATIPRPAGDFAIQMPDGRIVNISQYKGKVLAVEVLFTTCPHCQQTSKTLSKLYAELGPKGFQPLGAAINPNPNVPDFLKQFGVMYPVGTASREKALVFMEQSMMNPNFSVPILLIIDRGGTVRAQFDGRDSFFQNEEQNARRVIEKLLAEPAPQKAPAKPRRSPSRRTS